MSSDGTKKFEIGNPPTENVKAKKTLKSLVIPNNDPLKIKLKISKKEIVRHISGNSKESSLEFKAVRVYRNNSLVKLDVRNGEGSSTEETVLSDERNDTEKKMTLRSKRDMDSDAEERKEENLEVIEGSLKRKDSSSEKTQEKYKKGKKVVKGIDDEMLEKTEEISKRRLRRKEEASMLKPFESIEELKNINKESFCWSCHKDGSVIKCDTCPRVFHLKCVSLTKDPSKNWICPECSLVLHAEKMSTRSEAMKSLSLDQLCTLLNFAIDRMKNVPESQAFWKPVDPKEVPFYDKYITNPMDLNLLEKNMKAKMYGSPQAFLADTKWLLHNSIIFNSTQSPLTSTARFLVKICRQEMAEIENCPDCYLNAHTKVDWFIEVCRKPHILIWARLKGFPFWPAKAMSTNLKTQQVDARFFGAHDKAWVPVKECYLYSKNSPQLFSKKRADLDEAFLEAEGYIKKIRQKFGGFCYAPDKTPFVPEMYDKQLQSLIPNYTEEKVKKKRKGEPISNENGVNEKLVHSAKKIVEHDGTYRFKLKRTGTDDPSKSEGADSLMNYEYMSEEKIGDGLGNLEDEIARRLEIYDTQKKLEGEATEENSTDLDYDRSLPIPEHGYSRRHRNTGGKKITSMMASEKNKELEVAHTELNFEASEKSDLAEETDEIRNVATLSENKCAVESSEVSKSKYEVTSETAESQKTNSEQCEVSSTSADPKIIENENHNNAIDEIELDSLTTINNKSPDKSKPDYQEINQPSTKCLNGDVTKKEEDRLSKSFVNLTCEQKQKILNEAKLLANIDEMTAIGKQKILNQLGLDASNVDIRQLAQENRQILEALNKKCQSQPQDQNKESEKVVIKNEECEQYSIEKREEKNNEENVNLTSPKPGSIKVRDFHTLSREKDDPTAGKGPGEPILKIMDVQSLKDLKEVANEPITKRKKLFDKIGFNKKLKLEPTVKLIKLDVYNKSVDKLNRKLRLSDEVSLLMVDGNKKYNTESKKSGIKKFSKKIVKARARKCVSNSGKTNNLDSVKTSSKNINVISVDTENTVAQKKLLKSLRLEEKKSDDDGTKTVSITSSDKSSKNLDGKDGCESSGKKHMKGVTIEAIKETEKQQSNDLSRESNIIPPKNMAVVANTPTQLIVTNQGAQPNLALAQNNLGQLSLVHLSNLTSGIQTNFVNLTNETIGFNNSIGTLYASPGFNSDYPVSSATGSVILTPSLNASVPTPVGSGTAGGKQVKPGVEPIKLPVNRIGSTKSGAGISVKSPATLGLITSQSNKLPPLVAIPGDGTSLVGEVGSVTAELNKHSIKMAEYMRATIEDILRELSSQGSLEAKYKILSIEMEKLQWRHQQEIMELKHHSERSLMELRSSLESDKQKSLAELKAQMESQHEKVISETKRKQWCANCGKEALFYCCWNTSYCDYPCQQQHWPGHMNTCAQLGNSVSLGTNPAPQLPGSRSVINTRSPNSLSVMSGGGGYRINGTSGTSRREGIYHAAKFH